MKSITYKSYIVYLFLAAITSHVMAAGDDSEPSRGSFFISGLGELNAAPLTIKSVLNNDSLDDEIKGSYRPRLFWFSQLRAGISVDDCIAYLHNSSIGAIRTNQETLNFWKSYSGGGFQPADNTSYSLDIDAFRMRGTGTGAGCTFKPTESLSVSAEINFAGLNEASVKSIHGVAGATQGITFLNAVDSKWNISPILPQLQSAGTANAQWLAFSMRWKSASQPLHIDFDMPMLLGRIHAHSAAYIDRNWNLSKVNGVIKVDDGNAAIGKYGNGNNTYQIPNLWSIKGLYSTSQQFQPTFFTQGIGATTTYYFGNTWSSWLSNKAKLEVLTDSNIQTLLIAQSTDTWSLGLGLSVQKVSDLTKPLMIKFGLRY